MRLKLVPAALAAVLSISLLGATSASAATEFGDPCLANRALGEEVKATVFGMNSPSSPIPLAAPSAGVITSWKLNLITPPPPQSPIPAIIPQTLKVLRLNPTVKTALVIGESSGFVGSGLNTIPARVPVQPGDRLGLFGSGEVSFEGPPTEPGTLVCEAEPEPGVVIGAFPGTASTGATVAYQEGGEGLTRVPAVAVIEPDADNDGFGDETQDKCPQSATAQVACPVVQLSTVVTKKKRSITIAVTGTSAASVTVNGKAPLGKGKKTNLKGGTKAVTPGALTKFTLRFPTKLTKRLKELGPSKKLTLKITVSAPNVAATPTKKVIKVKLKGEAKP
jgi:hypothetical protein